MTGHTCRCGRTAIPGRWLCRSCKSARRSTGYLKGLHKEMRGGSTRGRILVGEDEAYLSLARALVSTAEHMGNDPGDLFTPDELELLQQAAEARSVERDPRYVVRTG